MGLCDQQVTISERTQSVYSLLREVAFADEFTARAMGHFAYISKSAIPSPLELGRGRLSLQATYTRKAIYNFLVWVWLWDPGK